MANNITLSYPSAFHHQFLDLNGKPLTGGKLYTYIAGSTTPVVTYKTISGGTESANRNTNPIILDMAGMAELVIATDTAYKFVLFDKNDAKIAEWDNVTGNIGGGGGVSEDIVVVGTPNEIDVSDSVTQGVKRYVISLSNSVKSTILYLIGLYNNVLNSLVNKADKVQGATAGNIASLDANGNITDSGSKVADFKTKQTPVADPSASGAGLEFIDSVSQNANGEITPHKKAVQDGTTAQKGVVKLSNAIDSTSVTEAATPKAVKDAYDELNNKIVARAVFLSQAEWDVQSQLPGDPAKVYYVENGTGEDAYTVYVWKESTSTYEEVDESSIDLDGYWHDSPTTTGSGNVVTDITLGNDGVPQVTKGLTALTQHQSVTDNDPTLAWGTRSKVGTIGGTDLHVTMPSNPASGKLDTTGDASNTTSTFTKASGDSSSMTSGSKLSVIFTAISSFFASLKALAFKDNVSNSDINGTISDSHIASASRWNGKQDSLGISSSGDADKYLNQKGSFTMPTYLNTQRISNSTDADTLTSSLTSRIIEEEATSTNHLPDNSSWWHLLSIQGNDNKYATQIALGMTTTSVQYRRKDNNVWSSWSNLRHASWINSGTFDAARIPTSLPNVMAGRASKLPATQVGSTATPVYVDSDGQVQECNPSQMSVGAASYASAAAAAASGSTLETQVNKGLKAYKETYTNVTLIQGNIYSKTIVLEIGQENSSGNGIRLFLNNNNGTFEVSIRSGTWNSWMAGGSVIWMLQASFGVGVNSPVTKINNDTKSLANLTAQKIGGVDIGGSPGQYPVNGTISGRFYFVNNASSGILTFEASFSTSQSTQYGGLNDTFVIGKAEWTSFADHKVTPILT